jgi:hypothetical protein
MERLVPEDGFCAALSSPVGKCRAGSLLQTLSEFLHAVFLSDELVKMPQREIWIDIALEPAQQLDCAEQEIGPQLGVTYVLEGSVRKAPAQLRIGVNSLTPMSVRNWAGFPFPRYAPRRAIALGKPGQGHIRL